MMDYRAVQADMFGDAGAWAYDEWHHHNTAYFDGRLAYGWILWGLTPHGHRLGETQLVNGTGRITLHPSLVAPSSSHPWNRAARLWNTRTASDVLLHEMIHQALYQRGDDSEHNGRPWCDEIERLSPIVLGRTVKAEPVNPRRITLPDRTSKVVRRARKGFLSRDAIAHWPHSLRPKRYSHGGEHLHVGNAVTPHSA
jgi:hypothetical protein